VNEPAHENPAHDQVRDVRRWRAWFTFAAWVVVIIAVSAIPFILFDGDFSGFVRNAISEDTSRWAVAAIAIALLVADLFLVIPSGLVIALVGGTMGALLGVIVGATGLTLACALGYWIGTTVGNDLAGDPAEEKEYGYAMRLVHRHGLLMLAACRPIPVLSELSVIAAGALRLPAARVLATTALANVGVAAVYAFIGASVGDDPWGLAVIVVAALALPAVMLLIVRWIRR